MGKENRTQKRIDLVFKRKRDDTIEVEEDQVLPLLELEQQQPEQQHNQDGGVRTNEVVTFRGIEFLQRDPGLRPQIWQYPPDQRDIVRRAYLMLGPMQPRLENYKPSGELGHQRRFQYSWFGDFPSWLEYSEEKSCVYCLYCFVSNNKENTRGGSHVFTVHGFDSWKRVCGKHCAFLTHIGSGPCSPHNNAVTSGHALMKQPCHIENVMAVRDKEKVERNRLRLKVSIAVVKWLAFQACAFRGHDERPESKNQGNFLEMVKLLAEFNPEIAKVVLGNAPYGAKYTSHDIQNEILSIFASKIRKHIREEVGDYKYSILVDETCDASKREQMALVLRFADKGGILQERFFDLIHVANTRSLTLKNELSFVLSNNGFDIQNLRGQGYDGASNMRGELNGLQALFLHKCPYAYYVHCYAHRLQLALVDASKEVVPISQFFQKLIFIINTVDSSSKRHDELHLAQLVELENGISNASIETGQGANQIRSLKRPGDTRWGSHFGSVYSLMKMFGPVCSVIQDIAADGSIGSIRADADTSFGYLSSFEFIFILCLMKEIFEITELLGQALQKKSQDIVNVVRLVSSTKQCLQELRSDDGYQVFITTVVEFCVNHSIDIPDFEETYIMRGGRARRQPDQFTKEHYFRVEIFFSTLDTQLFELSRRFNDKMLPRMMI
ncbi:zinc finger MYM-type protein 1 [Triticum aestivum]|uniref:zinc finger MYM-type protein 1 n=1 Tax=Triticum aestivum TaxID=4565 RepID=UPI001D016811|nr:zinc finger MYM-type protein 1-like [Triticum aestivum]